jgi:hypothetical protein
MTLHNIFAYFQFVGMQHGYDIDNVLLVNILVFVLIAKKEHHIKGMRHQSHSNIT